MKHPLHSLCPYFAMFPEEFVQAQLYAYSRPGSLVLDPFCGRGTTILESLLNGRRAIGADINPVAACIAGAKAEIPRIQDVRSRIDQLEVAFTAQDAIALPRSPFFEVCFHPCTLQEILYLRTELAWRTDLVDRFIAAMVLGALHGESHRSAFSLSNRMPRTISTKPDYSLRWWAKNGLAAPDRRTFEILRKVTTMRYAKAPPSGRARVVLGDARRCGELFSEWAGQVALIVTSPPYLDTTDYAEDQWLRLWFLGGPERPSLRLHRDDRHTQVDTYWRFLTDVWKGCERLLSKDSTIVLRIGGKKLGSEALLEGVLTSLRQGFAGRTMKVLRRASSTIKGRQTNAFRPGTTGERQEHDFAFRVS
jgi:hypothetical protein